MGGEEDEIRPRTRQSIERAHEVRPRVEDTSLLVYNHAGCYLAVPVGFYKYMRRQGFKIRATDSVLGARLTLTQTLSSHTLREHFVVDISYWDRHYCELMETYQERLPLLLADPELKGLQRYVAIWRLDVGWSMPGDLGHMQGRWPEPAQRTTH